MVGSMFPNTLVMDRHAKGASAEPCTTWLSHRVTRLISDVRGQPTNQITWTIEPGVVGIVDKDVGANPEGTVRRSFCAIGCLRRLVREGIHGEGDKGPIVGLDGAGCLSR